MASKCRSRVPANTTNELNMRLGRVFLNNRYYDPTTGQFLSVDPLVAVTGDPYLYAGGNPTTRSDPSGLDPGGCHNGRPNAVSGACESVSTHSQFTVDGSLGGKSFANVTTPIRKRSGIGAVTIDLYIAASQAGIVGMHDEGNDRGHCMGCPPQDSKVRLTLDFDAGSASLFAAPSCDAEGKGCRDAREWQRIDLGVLVDNSMNNFMITESDTQIRIQLRAKNARRDDTSFYSVPSIDDAYLFDVPSGRISGRGDRFPSETISQNLGGQQYQLSAYDEQVDFFGLPQLSDDGWGDLIGWNPSWEMG